MARLRQIFRDRKRVRRAARLGVYAGLSTLFLILLWRDPSADTAPVPPPEPSQDPIAAPVTPAQPREMALAVVTLPPPPDLPKTPDFSKATRQIAPLRPTPPTEAKTIAGPVEPMAPQSMANAAPVATVEALKPDTAAPAGTRIAAMAPNPSAKPRPAATFSPLQPESVAAPARPETRPEPAAVKPQPAAPGAVPARHTVDSVQAREGRTLLRLLEHGDGPDIEIAWPVDERSQNRLYDIMQRCYGMRTVLLHRDGRLFAEAGEKGDAFRLDADRYSRFIRQANGDPTAAEWAAAQAIRSRHGLDSADVTLVRIFPRSVDAAFLGGLSAMLGEGYADNRRLTARYALIDGQLGINDIRIDGTAEPGEIDLGGVSRCGHS